MSNCYMITQNLQTVIKEIHRDSDSRTIVFLLYLNKLSDQGEGGDLELYKYNNNQNKIPSRPKERLHSIEKFKKAVDL